MIVLPAGEGTDLVLRDPATDAEAAALLVRHRERVARVAPWAERVPDGPPDPDATATWTARFLRAYADGTGITCSVRHDGRLVGAVDATIDPRAATAELGWWLAPEAAGRGIARRAVEALGDHLVHRRGLRRLTAGITPDNERSLALVRRLGMSHEATRRSALAFGDRREDVLVHGVLADEWGARRPSPDRACDRSWPAVPPFVVDVPTERRSEVGGRPGLRSTAGPQDARESREARQVVHLTR